MPRFELYSAAKHNFMKKIVSVLALIFVLNSCDDGGFSIDNFDFSNVTATDCNKGTNQFFLKYISGNEVLLIQISEAEFFPNVITQLNQPRTATISSTNRVLYRVYSDNVTSDQICTSIPPANPVVREEWIAVSGIINVETFANRSNNATTGESFITGYTHLVTLINANFEKASGEQQLFAELNLGGYIRTVTSPTISFSSPILKCDDNLSFLYKNTPIQESINDIAQTHSIQLNIPSNLIQNTETQPGSPRTAAIDQNSTMVRFRVYNELNLPTSFFCDVSNPTPPNLIQDWIGRTSSGPDNGIIEVVTTAGFNSQGEQQYSHEIFLRRVRFDRGAVDFTFGNLYSLGTLVTFP